MKDDILTRPLPAGPDRFIGGEETDIRPFEPADIDWGSVNRRRHSDPTYGQGNKLYDKNPDGTVRPMTQSELVLIETDGTA